jgi:rhodanese-related sulfurtransferase
MLGSVSEDPTATSDEVSPERAAELLDSGEVQIVDVRADFEWAEGRIPGSLHVPLDQLPTRAGEIDRERPIVFVCRSGSRSAMAAEAFRASGLDAHNLVGGLELWVERDLPVEPEGGGVAKPRPDNS